MAWKQQNKNKIKNETKKSQEKKMMEWKTGKKHSKTA